MNLKEKIKGLPSVPGVYLMKDSLENIIYIGKSKNLKNRVSSYFQNSKNHSSKVIRLVQNLKDFDYIITDTEFEAFILECKLIKEIKPPYNRLMKSPMSYSYIQVALGDNCLDISLKSEAVKDDNCIYFGPYTSRNIVERGILGIKNHLKIACTNNSRKGSACINYSLKLCMGMCMNKVSQNQYIEIYNKILQLLNGSDKSIIEEMNLVMNNAAESFDFETAAKYRDYISSINYILDKKNTVEFMNKNRNIAFIEYLDDSFAKIFLIKGNRIVFSEKFNLNHCHSYELKATIKNNILFYFKEELLQEPWEINKENLDEAQIIHSYIKTKGDSCKYAIISEKALYSKSSLALDKSINKLLYNDYEK
ncbi:GIY-YIG nuclease family protein [Clostridium cellulovorans]|uniref:Excinuclease ABC C subunit domain protein n=1 Tax=Clostridium cellulovorans (strain ATCC 35296 / DSM 3052 / OCM 3 / 743B) TaxID=573061 RepID=D9SUR4_CLOC7|nr:GIY-YIG nuclease family protein [Clostridium cellulovorans]ADL50969.1 Excinuclease ABC C subunit domain protein [Clostridium cellulovorans 743B]